MKKALIIVDVQNNYFSGGQCELYHPVETAEKIKSVLDRFRKDQELVVFIQHCFNIEEAGSKEKDWYVQIHDIVKPEKNETVLKKNVPNSFHDTGLQELLLANQITDLVIVGMMSHMCIDTTVRAAFDQGYHITLLEDACCTKDMNTKYGIVSAQMVHDVFMGALSEVFANVVTTEEYIKKN